MLVYKATQSNRKSLNINPNSGYCLDYPKGAIVKAKEETLGIFCCKTYQHALNFAMAKKDLLILAVEGIGEGTIPEYISEKCTPNELGLFYSVQSYLLNGPFRR